MTLTLSMITADGKISLLLLTSTPDIPDISLTRMISPLMMMVSQSVNWAYVCTRMDMRLPNTGRNTDAQNRTEKNGRLYGIMMLQHLDAWEMPSIKAFQESLLGFTA